MKKPYKYFILCNKTSKVIKETDFAPRLFELQTWEETGIQNTKELKKTKTAYIDTRYDAKIRLYKYLKNAMYI